MVLELNETISLLEEIKQSKYLFKYSYLYQEFIQFYKILLDIIQNPELQKQPN